MFKWYKFFYGLNWMWGSLMFLCLGIIIWPQNRILAISAFIITLTHIVGGFFVLRKMSTPEPEKKHAVIAEGIKSIGILILFVSLLALDANMIFIILLGIWFVISLVYSFLQHRINKTYPGN